MPVFFLSDTHFGHGNILKYCQRPFLSDNERAMLARGMDFQVSADSIRHMDDAMIEAINAVVSPEDILWHLGDFCFKARNDARNYRDRIQCKKIYLIWGNHDRPDVSRLFTDCFDQRLIDVDGQKIFLNHYPMLSWDESHRGSWSLHGHVHGVLRRYPLIRPLYDSMAILDVGADGPDGLGSDHSFRPWSFAEVGAYMRTKSERPSANET